MVKFMKWNFRKAKLSDLLTVVGETTKRGTKVTFWPDETIMTVTEFDYDILAKRFVNWPFLNQGINIYFRDERNPEKDDVNFCYQVA